MLETRNPPAWHMILLELLKLIFDFEVDAERVSNVKFVPLVRTVAKKTNGAIVKT